MAIFLPTSISQAIGLAKLLEAKLSDVPSLPGRAPLYVPPMRSAPLPPLPPILPNPPSRSPPVPNPRGSLPICPLSSAEMRAYRAKRLCFNCDDLFTPGHSCRSKFLLLLFEDGLHTDETVTDFSGEFLAYDLPSPTPLFATLLADVQPPHSELFHLSKDALSGTPSPRTLHLCNSIGGYSITVLIDSGIFHNIIQPRIAHHLHLEIQPLPPFAVMVGNDKALYCSQLCSVVSLTLQHHTFAVPPYLLPIHGADLVLGV
ncbi:UNVERIFIED_CONTAM: hypothetical protein Scaly_1621200 [Sesamum calycinum]|uniref:Uncharacterized protein n=1 Tax=Sesamum calycinum TaxID=2727403 RepID=A0AAW2P8E6_9LAMI